MDLRSGGVVRVTRSKSERARTSQAVRDEEDSDLDNRSPFA